MSDGMRDSSGPEWFTRGGYSKDTSGEPTREAPLATKRCGKVMDYGTNRRCTLPEEHEGNCRGPISAPLATAGEPTIHEALKLMVKELNWYAAKYGLGPAKLQYALSQGERALAAAGQPASGAQPFAYACPANCGCIWRDNKDGTMSLFGKRSQSCEVCEPLSLEKLVPLYVAAPAMAQLSAGDIQRVFREVGPTSTNPHFDWGEYYVKIADLLNTLLRSQPAQGELK